MAGFFRTDPYLNATKSDGSTVLHANDGYVSLAAATYVFPLGAQDVPLESIHIQTDAALVAVFTIETHNAPRVDAGSTQPGGVSDYDVTAAGGWVKEDPSTAYVATVGTGWTVSNLTLTKAAGVGSAMLHLGNLGSRRVRLTAVVSTPGTVRVSGHGKG